MHEALSPPSSQISLTVAPTAVQFGSSRMSYEDLYLLLFIIFLIAAAVLAGFGIYHRYRFLAKSSLLRATVAEAEESVRRGFAVVRRDIESELEIIRRAKLTKELSGEEKRREEKLIKDLEDTNNYIGAEIWKIEKAEKELE